MMPSIPTILSRIQLLNFMDMERNFEKDCLGNIRFTKEIDALPFFTLFAYLSRNNTAKENKVAFHPVEFT